MSLWLSSHSEEDGVSQFLFPLDNAESFLRRIFPSLDRSGGTLRWASGGGLSELKVSPIAERTFDGLLVSEIVMLTHTSPAFANVPRNAIAAVNAWATISSFVPADAAGSARLVAKVGVFSTDREAAERLYAPLLCTEAAVSGWHATRIMRGQHHMDPEDSPLSLTSQDPPFDNADFEALQQITAQSDYVSSLGERHFTVEFPWDAGAKTNLLNLDAMREEARKAFSLSEDQLDRLAGKTSLLQIRFGDHPFYGKGIHCTLELPFPPNDPATVQLVNELNAWELSGADLPPHFGAWCIGSRAAAYVCFLPTQYCLPGLLSNLTVWMGARQARVREWLKASSTQH